MKHYYDSDAGFRSRERNAGVEESERRAARRVQLRELEEARIEAAYDRAQWLRDHEEGAQ